MKKKLYWIDDETRFYPIISMLCPSELELVPYAGLDRTADFIEDLSKIIADNHSGQEISYFLIDILMPVPPNLRASTIWQKNLRAYNTPHQQESICGLALAYLIDSHIKSASEIKSKERIRLLTSYSHHMLSNIGSLKINNTAVKELIISKAELSTEHLINLTTNEWVKNA